MGRREERQGRADGEGRTREGLTDGDKGEWGRQRDKEREREKERC